MSALYSPRDAARCLAICGVVGVVLVSINQGPAALLSAPEDVALRLRIALNFAVPFTVASASALLANRARMASPAS